MELTEDDIDPHWDALMSNPALGEAFGYATNELGYDEHIRAHAYARFVVYGPEYAERKFDEEVVESVREDAERQLKAVTGRESEGIEKQDESPLNPLQYQHADKLLFEAHEESVGWKAGTHPDNYDISKAPRI